MGAYTTAILAASGVAMQVYGQYQQGQDAQQAADYNAAVYKQQSQVIDVKKDITAEQFDRASDRLRGATVNAIQSSGYDLSGSKLHVLNDNLAQVEWDKSIELYNLEIDRTRAISSANEYTARGQREARSSTIQAGATLLTTGNDWYQSYGGFGKTT